MKTYALHASDRIAPILVGALGACLFVLSQGAYYGDSTTYAADVIHGKLIEPGHLIWRPLGGLIYTVMGGHSSYSSALWQLQFLNLAASLLCIIALYGLASKLAGKLPAIIASVMMLISNGFWAYSFSGCSYSLSILFIILSLDCVIQDANVTITPRAAILAGVFSGLSASTWAIQVLAAPAIWLTLVTASSNSSVISAIRSKNSVRFVTGCFLSFSVPLVLAFSIVHWDAKGHFNAGGSVRTFMGWVTGADHGIPTHENITQLLRVAIGWPQSIISIFNIGSQLRLWHFGERHFPLSPALLVFVAFYGAIVGGTMVLARNWRSNLTDQDRKFIVAGIMAILLNLLFAVTWQGADLERYFPSLPFQLLIAALVVRCLAGGRRNRVIITSACVILLMLGLTNWFGTFQPQLGPSSYRQQWLRHIKQVATAHDVLLTFGQRTALLVDPHDQDMPKIDNLANQIITRGKNWREGMLPDIAEVQKVGGRAFIDDALFQTGSSPREGWSFKEYPAPSPQEIYETFIPYKSNHLAFTVDGEKVWLAK